MPVVAFPKRQRLKPKPPQLSDVTLRDFSGGLKNTDNEIALTSKFASKLINMWPDPDTSQVLRFGTKEYATVSNIVINLTYFRQHLICVLENGEIEKVDSAGTVTSIWNATIAAALPGAPSGWSGSLTLVDFSEFRGELIITNGVDKPLIVDNTLSVDYLQDIPTGSNVNTPITKFVTTVANYLVMAGISGGDTTIYVSATGTSGTWPSDPAPNDSISFDAGAYTGQSSSKIIGIGSFKNFLVVFFNTFSVIFQLGNYDGSGNHLPTLIDSYPNLGTVNHKTFLATETDLIYAGNSGVISAEKHVIGNTLQTEGMAENLADDYPATLGLVAKNDLDCFVVNDPLTKTVFFIFHKEDATIKAFGMRYRENFTKTSWAEVTGWSFTCGCTSEKGRVFFGEGTKVYQYGNSVFEDEAFYADYTTNGADGNDIAFDWEFPWLDAGNRIKSKTLKKVAFDTTGSSEFSLQCFVNNFYKDINGVLLPVVEMPFVAGNAGGYGNNEEGFGGDGYGGGRRANDERFYGLPIKFRILKMRIYGTTKKPLRIASISLIYARGNYNV